MASLNKLKINQPHLRLPTHMHTRQYGRAIMILSHATDRDAFNLHFLLT
jgi:hypothetical protein